MERVAVESSVILSVGYDPGEAVLEIEFTSGRIYQYFEVPPEEHRALMDAESHGAYFNDYIRNGYPYVPVHRSRRR